MKKTLQILLIVCVLSWSINWSFVDLINSARAAGGIELMSTFENGTNVLLSNANTPEAFARIAAYETASGTHTLNSITLYIMPYMDCMGGSCTESPFLITDLSSFSTASTSGLSLWLDDGDDTFEFDFTEDTLISSTTATIATLTTANTNANGQITVAETMPGGGTFTSYPWEVTFSNLNIDITGTYGALDIFVAAKAESASIDESPLNKFMPILPLNGIDITTSNESATIADFPSDYNWPLNSVSLSASGGDNMMYGTPIVISEIQTAGTGGATDEFIELYNTTVAEYDLSSWSVQYWGSEAGSAAKVNLSGTIPANGYYLITNSGGYDYGGTVAADKAQTAISLSATGGTVFLVNNQTTLTVDTVGTATSTADKVAWGTGTSLFPEGITVPAPPTDGSLERKAYPSSNPSSMIGGIDANKGNMEDTNDNSADFIVRLTADISDPQNNSSATETSVIQESDRTVIINEALYNTASGNGWIELYNASGVATSTNNWTITVATSTSQIYTFPDVDMATSSYIVIYWNQSGTNDTDTTDGLGALYVSSKTDMSTFGGDITLKNSSSAIQDYIQYGGSGKAGQTAAANAGVWTVGDYMPGSNYNESIARVGTTGDDHNVSGDFMYMSTPTPGYPNTGGDSTAPDTATNVVLTDTDSDNYGLDGNDIRVTWVPSTTYDSSFDRYELYILPAATTLNTALHTPYGNLYGQYLYESGTASSSQVFTGTGSTDMSYDSVNTLLSATDYRAYIVTVDMSGNQSSAVGSAPATLISEGSGDVVADTNNPMIDHMPTWEAKVDQDLTFYARMGDDRDSCSIATSSIIWKIGNDVWGNATTTACTLPAMAGSTCLRECVISWPASGWDADTTIYYYLAAYDQADNSTFMGMYPSTTESEVQNSVWTSSIVNNSGIDFVATADWNDDGTVADITGVVYDEAGAPLQDAFVYVNGIATSTATTTVAGIFSIPDNSLRHPFSEIKVMKSGYMEQMRNASQNSTDNNFYLTTGYMSAGAGGSSGGTGIAWTAPMEGMMMAPTNISCDGDCSTMTQSDMPISIGFFNSMNSNTIDDMDASNAGSNIYLTSDGNTKIADTKVKYVSSSNEARIYSSTALSSDTFYTVVITSGVLDTDGNPIESNRPSGNYEFSFSTMSDNATMWGGFAAGAVGADYSGFGDGGMMMPPYVNGTNPTPGQYSVPLGAVLTVEFSEPMDSSSIASNVKLYRITSESSWSGVEVTDKNVSATLDNATKKIVTITHDVLDANASNNNWYEIRVMAGAKSQLGIWMGDPMSNGCTSNTESCLAAVTHYTSSFQVSTSADETKPTVAGTYPSNNDGITAGTSAVDVSIPSIEIGFSEGMNPSTINNQTITLKKGTASVSGTLSYDSMSNSAKFTSNEALTSNSVYTLTITTSVTDLSSNALASNNIINFKTGSADIVAPEVMYANGDDYQIAVTFTEPMNASLQTDATNWPFSVLNPTNYFINTLDAGAACTPAGTWACGHALIAPYNTVDGNPASTTSNITISYDAPSQTITLKGFDMCGSNDFASCASSYFQIFIDNVKDKSGNVLTDSTNRSGDPNHRNASRSALQNSATTYGMLGPGGGPGMMMGGGGPGGTNATGGPGMDMGQMGMYGAGAFPMNAMAGQTSIYAIDIPLVMALKDGMQIVLTFPTGFNVSNVAKDLYSPMNNDMNEWNNGTVTFDTSFGVGGIASTTSRVITTKLDVSGTVNSVAGPDGFIDFLHFDLKGIKNSSIPKDFGTSGYTVDIKTKSSDGAIMENLSTMPFFITEGGSNTLTVVVDSGNTGQDTGTMNIFLGSPMTGPMEGETTTFDSGIATSTFTNLPSADFMLFTDPYITIDSTTYLGKPMPEYTQVSGDTTKTITLEQEGAGTSKMLINTILSGNFVTGGSDDDIDIFANSPTGFRVKTLTSVGNVTNSTSTMYLTEGEWMMGMGIAMPKGPMAGPPKMPDWMEPQMVNVIVGIEAINDTVNLDPDGSTDAATGNNEPILLPVASTDYFKVGDTVSYNTNISTSTITAVVEGTSITVIPVAGTNWGTNLPAQTGIINSARETSSVTNDGNISFNISTQTLKYIYGYVVDGSGNALGDTEVYAYQPQGFGGGHTTTDTAGRFSLKIGANGVWTVGAFKQGMPNAQEKSIEVKANVDGADGNTTADVYLNGIIISDASNDNTGTNPLRLNLQRPGYTISGKILNSNSVAVPYAPVWAYQPTSWGHADTMTDSSGNYILYVDAGTWQIEADAPGLGWMQYETDVTITTADQSNINLRPDSDITFHVVSGTATIDGNTQTYMPLRAVKYNDSDNDGTPETYGGRDYSASTDSNGQFTISLPAGYYRIDTWTPGYGEVELVYDQYLTSPANINVNEATTTANIILAAADLQTISIQFNNGLATQTGFLNAEEVDMSSGYPQPTGYRVSTDITGLNATSTIKLEGSSTGKYYFFDLYVEGYGFYMPTAASRALLTNTNDNIKVVDAPRAVYFDLPNASTGVLTISGTVKDDSTNNLADAWVWVGNPNSQFHHGAQSGSDGTFSLTIPTLVSGDYNIGADKPGYISLAPATISGSIDSLSQTVTLTANSKTITGYVYADANSSGDFTTGEGIPNAWVWADEPTGGKAYVAADSNGYYELGVSGAAWQVYAGADGYTEDAYRNNNTKLRVSTVSANGIANVALSTNANWIQNTKSKPITPSSGGTIDDSGDSGTGVKLTIPPNAMGSDSNSGNVSIQDTSSVAQTTSASPLGGAGVSITATDNAGNAITNLDDYIDIELVYYQGDIANMNIVDYSKLKNLKLSYWDNSLNNWIDLATSRKAYYKTLATDTEWTMQADSATQTGYLEFIDTLVAGTTYSDYKLVLTGKTDHFTVFSATQPQDGLSPAVPTGAPTQSSGTGTAVGLSWTAVTTNSDATTIVDLLGYEVYRSTDGTTYTQVNTSDVATNSYSDTSTTAWTSYYYKITATDDGGNETAVADSTAVQVCSNKTLNNGTVDANCSITCNTNYRESNNTCVSAGGAIAPGGGGSNNTPTTTETTDTTDTTADTTAEKVKEVTTKITVEAQEFAQKIVEIVSEASEVVKANVESLLAKFGLKRSLAKEQVTVKKYVKNLIKGVKGLKSSDSNAITNFVAYGTDTTKKLGEGERAGVVNSYKSAFGKLPTTDTEWSDAIKIANGRWPTERSETTEARATISFKTIYKRAPNRANPHDDAAVTVMAYGLRPGNRNLNSEKTAIKSFKAIYGYNPTSATNWDAVRAIAYSGATR